MLRTQPPCKSLQKNGGSDECVRHLRHLFFPTLCDEVCGKLRRGTQECSHIGEPIKDSHENRVFEGGASTRACRAGTPAGTWAFSQSRGVGTSADAAS